MFATPIRRGCSTAGRNSRLRFASLYSEPYRIPLQQTTRALQFTTSSTVHFEFPLVPADVLQEVDQKKPLANSVNLYARHFAVSSGEYYPRSYHAEFRYNWPSTTKEDIQYGPAAVETFGDSPPFKLSQFLVDWATALKPNKDVMYTKSSYESSTPCIHVYPDNLKITFTSPSPTLPQIQQFQSEWMTAHRSPQRLDFITVDPLPSNAVHIYICSHRQRDHRCGVIGNLLISSMREYLKSSTDIDPRIRELDIEVFGCSHVGGHKYAGNMVIYRPHWKQGVWYGRVQPKDIPLIVEKTVLEGTIVGKFWRGGLPSGRWDPKEHITADEAESRATEELEDARCACAK